jgi:hypothetical protein
MNQLDSIYTANLATAAPSTTTEPSSCERVRVYLNSRNFNLGLLERSGELSRHVETCVSCTRAVNARKQVQQFLRGRLL